MRNPINFYVALAKTNKHNHLLINFKITLNGFYLTPDPVQLQFNIIMKVAKFLTGCSSPNLATACFLSC